MSWFHQDKIRVILVDSNSIDPKAGRQEESKKFNSKEG